MSKIRRISLALFIVIFIVAAPSLVLYANGWRIDTFAKKLVQTGAIYLNMNVREAHIYVNNDLKKTTSPISSSALINNIIPGIKKVRIEKTGYIAWEKEIRVKPQQTARFMNVLLLPTEIKKQSLITTDTEKTIKNFSSSPNGNFLAIQYNDDTLKIWSSNEKIFLSLDVPDIPFLWSADNSMAFIKINTNRLLALNLNKKTERYINLASSMIPLPRIIHDNDIFFVGTSKTTEGDQFSLISERFQNETFNKIESLILSRQITAFTTNQNSVYFLDKERILWNIQADGTGLKQLSQAPVEINDAAGIELTVSESGDNIAVKEIADGRIWFFDRSSKTFEFVRNGIRILTFSPDEKKLLLTSRNEIYVYFLKETFNPRREDKTLELITRLSGEIDKTWWHPQSEHIIFTYGDTIQIIELESSGTRNGGTLISGQIKNEFARNGQVIITLYEQGLYSTVVPRIQNLLAF